MSFETFVLHPQHGANPKGALHRDPRETGEQSPVSPTRCRRADLLTIPRSVTRTMLLHCIQCAHCTVYIVHKHYVNRACSRLKGTIGTLEVYFVSLETHIMMFNYILNYSS